MRESKQLEQLIQTIDTKLENLDALTGEQLIKALDDLAETLKTKPKWVYKEEQIEAMSKDVLFKLFDDKGIL